jgi:hypothetical protein
MTYQLVVESFRKWIVFPQFVQFDYNSFDNLEGEKKT